MIHILSLLTMQNPNSHKKLSPKFAILSKKIRILKKIILRISMVILSIININQIVMSRTFLFNYLMEWERISFHKKFIIHGGIYYGSTTQYVSYEC